MSEMHTDGWKLENATRVEGKRIIWSCPACDFEVSSQLDEDGNAHGYVHCDREGCRMYGYDLAYARGGSDPEVIAQGCKGCTPKEWADYAERYPHLAAIDLKNSAQ